MSNATGTDTDAATLERLRREVVRFNGAYGRVLDDGALQHWPLFFADDAVYVITARENYDQNLPVGLVYCEGRAMMEDRVFALQNTAMYAPRYLRHFITDIWVNAPVDGVFNAGANYMVTQVLMDEPAATVHQVGRYIDRFREVEGGLLLCERLCVYDNALIDTALVMPV